MLGRNRPKIHREIEVHITGLVLTSGTQEATREGAPLVSRAVNSRPLIIFKGCGSHNFIGALAEASARRNLLHSPTVLGSFQFSWNVCKIC